MRAVLAVLGLASALTMMLGLFASTAEARPWGHHVVLAPYGIGYGGPVMYRGGYYEGGRRFVGRGGYGSHRFGHR